MSLTVTILAGGLGKRMRSEIPKVLHKLNGIPMLVKILTEARQLNPVKIVIVVGKYKQIIEKTLIEFTNISDIEFAIQEESLGTGDAVKSTLTHLDRGYNLILNGDIPLIKYDTLKFIVDKYHKKDNKLQITCIKLDDPSGCGRIIVNNNNVFESIVEHKDCNNDQLKINVVNVGIYVADTDILKRYIPDITNNNAQNEYYLTDLVKIYKNSTNNNVGLAELDSSKIVEISNVNTKEQLQDLNKLI